MQAADRKPKPFHVWPLTRLFEVTLRADGKDEEEKTYWMIGELSVAGYKNQSSKIPVDKVQAMLMSKFGLSYRQVQAWYEIKAHVIDSRNHWEDIPLVPITVQHD